MNPAVSVLIVVLITSETYTQISPKFQYSTGTRYQHDDTIAFPDSVEDDTPKTRVRNQGNAIPLELLEKINNVSNITQFFDEIISEDTMDSREVIASRFGEDNIERSVGIVPKPANCIPEDTIVPLEPVNMSKDPTIIYFPSCTRVKRCGGCCSSPVLSCQAIESETKTFSIFKSQFVGGSKMAYRGKENVLVDEHTKCACDCRIKKTDCNNYQIYDSSQCKCICSNYDEQQKCLGNVEKVWDSENCTCRCRETKDCTTGTYFDEHQCKCYETPQATNNDPNRVFDRKKFIIKAIPVIPDNNTQYQTGE